MIVLILIVIAVLLFFLLKSDKKVTCETIECFEENFNKCSPAIWDNSYSEEMVSYFEILGKEDGFCKLKQVISTPQTGELEQTCKLDNSLGLDTIMEPIYDENGYPIDRGIVECEGSLYDFTQQGRDIISAGTRK